ncbi:MAG: TnpV protein [Clostridia bacterium]|nr:TnpV protein [Clostridia bacterium]
MPKAEALTEPAGETRHYEFLKQNRPSTVGVMRMNGTLEGYLREVNREATEMLEALVRQYVKAEGVTEALKRADQLGWVQKMNNIRNRAEEVVLNEIIYR